MLEIYGKSDRGNVRENNEDRICYPRPQTTSPTPPAEAGQLLLVADGVGGIQGGEHASRLTAETVKRVYYYSDHAQDPRWLLRRAIEAANQEVLTYTSTMPALRGAASTVTAAVIKGNQLYVANVGDSRTYVIRADGRSQQISMDHSLTQQKINQKLLDPTQAKSDVDSHVITRSVGLESSVDVDIFPPATVQPPYIPLALGDAVLLCSDGLTDLVTDEDIARIVAANPPQKAVNQLIKLAKRNGGHDNISVIVGRVPGQGRASAISTFPGARAILKTRPRVWLTVLVLLIMGAVGLALRSVWPDLSPTQLAAPTTALSTAVSPVTATPTSATVRIATPAPSNPGAAPAPTVTRIVAVESTAPTPTGTPVGTRANVNAVTATPPPSLAATLAPVARPELRAPDPNYAITGDVETTFAWQWAGVLAPNQGFEILLWPQGKVEDKRGIHDAKETQTLAPDADGIYRLRKKIPNRDAGNYEWTVAVVSLDRYERMAEASPRPIKISSPGGNTEPNSGAAQPRP